MWINRVFGQSWNQQSEFPVRVLRGVRQSGKSTFLRIQSNEETRPYVTMDDLQTRQLAQSDPKFFLDSRHTDLILDEVQYAPEIFPEIKHRVDNLKFAKLSKGIAQQFSYWLTGSNQILVNNSVRESLAGRAQFYILHPLSIEEIFDHFSLNKKLLVEEIPGSTKFLLENLWRGGYPELYQDNFLDIAKYQNDYIQTVIEKDVALSAGVQKINEFLMVTKLSAARTGQLLNYSDICKKIGLPISTVSGWIGLLSQSLFVYLLPAYSTNINSRTTRTPKLHWLDSGLAIRLQGWGEKAALFQSPNIGNIFESVVVAEALKTRDHLGLSWELYHWRLKETHEIDLLVVTKTKTVAVEVKWSENVTAGEVDFSSLKSTFPDQLTCVVVTATGSEMQLASHSDRHPGGLFKVPVHLFAKFLRSHLQS